MNDSYFLYYTDNKIILHKNLLHLTTNIKSLCKHINPFYVIKVPILFFNALDCSKNAHRNHNFRAVLQSCNNSNIHDSIKVLHNYYLKAVIQMKHLFKTK